MGNTQDTYQAATLHVLAQFQLLEQALKMYVSSAYELIGTRVKGLVPFHYSGNDVEAFPLERLIGTFAKVNANHTLISRLNKLPKKRNDIAHKSLLIAYGGYGDLMPELTGCLRAVLDELGRLPKPDHGHEA